MCGDSFFSEISEGTAAAAIEESPSRKRKATDSKKARRPKSGQKRSAEKERQSKSSRAAPKPKKPKPAVEYKSDDDEDVLEEEDTNLFDRESDDDYAPNEDAAPSAPKVRYRVYQICGSFFLLTHNLTGGDAYWDRIGP